jgi:transposase
MRYSEAFKAKMVKKMAVPGGWSASALSDETGVPQPTLSRWLRDARNFAAMDKPKSEKPKRKQWTPAEKLRVVVEAGQLSGDELGAFLRREGLHEAQLHEWREAAEKALSSSSKRRKAEPSAEDKRIKALEKDLRRKEKALAEASALLILKKKMEAYWEGEDDGTDDGSER